MFIQVALVKMENTNIGPFLKNSHSASAGIHRYTGGYTKYNPML